MAREVAILFKLELKRLHDLPCPGSHYLSPYITFDTPGKCDHVFLSDNALQMRSSFVNKN